MPLSRKRDFTIKTFAANIGHSTLGCVRKREPCQAKKTIRIQLCPHAGGEESHMFRSPRAHTRPGHEGISRQTSTTNATCRQGGRKRQTQSTTREKSSKQGNETGKRIAPIASVIKWGFASPPLSSEAKLLRLGNRDLAGARSSICSLG